MFDWVFAIIHLMLFFGLIVYALLSLIRGHMFSGLVLLAFLIAYYFIVLHQAVLKEFRRKKKAKNQNSQKISPNRIGQRRKTKTGWIKSSL